MEVHIIKPVIVLFIGSLSHGGAERVISFLANSFYSKGYNVIVLTTYRGKQEYPLKDGIPRVVISENTKLSGKFSKNISCIRYIRNLCKREKVSVLVSFLKNQNVKAVPACIGIDTKCIVSVRNDPNKEYKGIIGLIIGKLLLPMADGCIFQTEDAQRWFSRRLQKHSEIIFNPVSDEFFNIKRNNTRNIVSVCRLTAQKNLELLINSFSDIADKYPNENLLIYGEGELKNRLEDLINSKRLGKRIFLMGLTDDVAKVLSTAKIFALSSDYEGMPNSLMEALAAGVPCVATDCPCGGPKMLIKNKYNGLLVGVNDRKGFAAALDKLLSNQEFAEKLGKNAADMALECYRSETVLNQWERYIYKYIKKIR